MGGIRLLSCGSLARASGALLILGALALAGCQATGGAAGAPAVSSIEQLEQARDIGSLVRALSSPDAARRMEAVDALGALRDKRAVDPLIALLADPSRAHRKRVARALVKIGDVRAAGPVVGALMPEEPMPPAPDTLAYVVGGGGTFLSKELPKFGPAVVPVLVKAMRLALPQQRGYYARALGMLGRRARPAVPTLIKLFPTDPPFQVTVRVKGGLSVEELAVRYGPGHRFVTAGSISVPGHPRQSYRFYQYTFTAPAAAAALYEITGHYRGRTRNDWTRSRPDSKSGS